MTSKAQVAAGKEGAKAANAAVAQDWLPAALTQLHMYLMDDDVSVITKAQATLRSVPLAAGHQASSAGHQSEQEKAAEVWCAA